MTATSLRLRVLPGLKGDKGDKGDPGLGDMTAANNLSELTDKAIARSNLQLGTAALKDTGTSGDKVPLLANYNTWTKQQVNSGCWIAKGTVTDGAVASSALLGYLGATLGAQMISIGANNSTAGVVRLRQASLNFSVDRDLFWGKADGTFAFPTLTTAGAVQVDSSGNASSGTLPLANGGTGATTDSGARTALGLGTAATQNTGTSGANVPLLNAANTWSTDQTNQHAWMASGALALTVANRSGLDYSTGGNLARIFGIGPDNSTAASLSASVYSANGSIALTGWTVSPAGAFKLNQYTSPGVLRVDSSGNVLATPNPTRTVTGTTDTLVASDCGKLIIYNSASAVAVTVTAAATLGNGWFCDIVNINSGILTVDPNSTETIDGASTASVYQGERMRIVCDGSNFYTTNHAGEWVTYAPTVGPTTGSFAGGSPTVTGTRVKKIRTTVFYHVQFTLPSDTTGGTGNVNVSLPPFGTPLRSAFLVGGSVTSGLVLRGIWNSVNFVVGNYANATMIANNAQASLDGQYEVAP